MGKNLSAVLVLGVASAFLSTASYAKLSEKTLDRVRERVATHFSQRAYDEDREAYAAHLLRFVAKMHKPSYEEKAQVIWLLEEFSEEKKTSSGMDHQLASLEKLNPDTPNGNDSCPFFLAPEEGQKLSTSNSPTKKRSSFLRRLREAFASKDNRDTKRLHHSLKDGEIADLFKASCGSTYQKISHDCANPSNPCEPKKKEIPGLNKLHVVVRALSGRKSHVFGHPKDSCFLKEFLEISRASLARQDFAVMSPDQFRTMREFFLRLIQMLKKHPNSDLAATYADDLKDLLKKHDPFGPYGESTHIIEEVCKLTLNTTGADLGSLNVRHIVLFEDLLSDSETHSKLNTLLRSRNSSSSRLGGFMKNSSGCLNQLAERNQQELLLGPLYLNTYLSKRIDSYQEVDQKLQKKLNEFSRSGAQLKLTSDEAWLLDHQAEAQNLLRAMVNSPVIDMTQAKNLKEKLTGKLRDQDEAYKKLEDQAFRNYRAGDLILFSGDRQHQYYGKDGDLHDKARRVLLGGDTNHAAVMVRKKENGKSVPYILESLEGGMGISTTLAKADTGREYYNSGYRFNLSKMVGPELQTALTKAGIDTPEKLDAKIREYDDEYFTRSAEEFSPEANMAPNEKKESAPKYKVRNNEAARALSVIPRGLRNLLKPKLKSIVENDRLVDAVYKDLEKKVALEKRQKKMTLHEKVVATRERGKIDGAVDEICSEFAFSESIRYLDFLDKKLKQDLKLPPGVSALKIPNLKVQLQRLHPGKLERMVHSLVKQGVMIEVPPTLGLFDEKRGAKRH